MAETVTQQTSAADEAAMQIEMAAMFAEMHRLNALMKQDQEEIDRLKEETRAIIASTDAALERMEAR